jgi:hypothetical protein
MKVEKFDLEKVIHGARVITRDGREVTQLTKFETYDKFCLYGVVDDEVECWTIDGQYTDNSSCSMDLFLVGKVRRAWVNVYKNDNQNFVLSNTYKTKESAINCRLMHYQYIKTIEITDEV